MKPSIQLHLHQQLSLTPQLQQAIRLLQLSQLELVTELRELTEANPLLELLDDEPTAEDIRAESPAGSTDGDADENTWEPDPGLPDTSLDFSHAGNTSAAAPPDDAEPTETAPEGLREHLMWQLNLSPLTPRERLVATVIIDALDRNGYLNETPETLLATLPSSFRANLDDIESVRRQVQTFDPAGVASINLGDCLDAQLRQLAPDTSHELARRIVADGLDLLARNDLARLARKLRADPEDVADACALIRSLNPRPGAAFDPTPVEYVIPDAYVRRGGDHRWHVSLSPNSQPNLQINQHYCDLIKTAQRDDAAYLRGQLQEARWLLKSLETRADTVLKVATAIVERQRAFLEYGPEAMRPLVLREIAEQIGMHESTISRVTTRKYLHTPRGIFEFKYFFSSSVATTGGGSASSTAIQAMIGQLIAGENPRKPLSDQALAKVLEQRGIHVARRTIAKYREVLRIPSSSERQRAS
ncbi:MAG TPA: RNA polymerase factor sigma-54 [Rhodanobacteraceae bacterium]